MKRIHEQTVQETLFKKTRNMMIITEIRILYQKKISLTY